MHVVCNTKNVNFNIEYLWCNQKEKYQMLQTGIKIKFSKILKWNRNIEIFQWPKRKRKSRILNFGFNMILDNPSNIWFLQFRCFCTTMLCFTVIFNSLAPYDLCSLIVSHLGYDLSVIDLLVEYSFINYSQFAI